MEMCGSPGIDGRHYKRLRTFSEQLPTPSGEENFESWMGQATHMIKEWQCTNGKRKRIEESLRDSASDVLRALRFGNAYATYKIT